MRNFLCLTAAFALSTATLEPRTADACGGSYSFVDRTPRTYAVSTHFIPRTGSDSHRGFIALGGSAPSDAKWEILAPMTYDATKIAPGPTGGAMTLTLVGDKGSRQITSSRYVWLRDSMFMTGSTLALEFDVKPGERFDVAILGKQPTAKWMDLPERTTSKTDASWVRNLGFHIPHDHSISVYRSGDVSMLTFFDEKSSEITTVVRKNDREISRHLGWPRGTVDVAGTRYLAMGYKRDVSLIAI